MAKPVKYESLIEKLTREYGESYQTAFKGDRADFNLPSKPKTMTDLEQSSYTKPVGGRQPTKGRPGDAEQFSDENTQLSLKSSSTIQAAAYWPSKEYLLVSFKSGHTYSYQGVDLEVVQAWQEAASAGSFFYYNIRTSYPYLKQG